MLLYAFVVCAIALAILYIHNYFHNLNQTAEIERQRQKKRAEIKEWELIKQVKRLETLSETEQTDRFESLRKRSWKYVPHAGWNFASTPTERENLAENFQNSQLNSSQASATKKRIRENS